MLIFISLSERHHLLPEREEDHYIICFITVFLLLKNYPEIWKKIDETLCWYHFPSSQVLEPFLCTICLISIIDSII